LPSWLFEHTWFEPFAKFKNTEMNFDFVIALFDSVLGHSFDTHLLVTRESFDPLFTVYLVLVNDLYLISLCHLDPLRLLSHKSHNPEWVVFGCARALDREMKILRTHEEKVGRKLASFYKKSFDTNNGKNNPLTRRTYEWKLNSNLSVWFATTSPLKTRHNKRKKITIQCVVFFILLLFFSSILRCRS
jgi:hypothetical protein